MKALSSKLAFAAPKSRGFIKSNNYRAANVRTNHKRTPRVCLCLPPKVCRAEEKRNFICSILFAQCWHQPSGPGSAVGSVAVRAHAITRNHRFLLQARYSPEIDSPSCRQEIRKKQKRLTIFESIRSDEFITAASEIKIFTLLPGVAS